MKYTFVGRQEVVSDAIKSYTEKKFGRVQKLVPEGTDVIVTYDVIKTVSKVEVTVHLPKRVLRAEVTDGDMYAAIDKVADTLELQLVKYKNRLKCHSGKYNRFKDEYNEFMETTDDDIGEETNIIRTKRFAIKPMDAEEAVLEMDLLGHSFYVFRNAITDEVNVVYKRKDNNYGLIEPEF
ncbi:MAG: ribosome hibernation-promoting factor, HPF/YfiA family [Lachnospirales bacterium]